MENDFYLQMYKYLGKHSYIKFVLFFVKFTSVVYVWS